VTDTKMRGSGSSVDLVGDGDLTVAS